MKIKHTPSSCGQRMQDLQVLQSQHSQPHLTYVHRCHSAFRASNDHRKWTSATKYKYREKKENARNRDRKCEVYPSEANVKTHPKSSMGFDTIQSRLGSLSSRACLRLFKYNVLFVMKRACSSSERYWGLHTENSRSGGVFLQTSMRQFHYWAAHEKQRQRWHRAIRTRMDKTIKTRSNRKKSTCEWSVQRYRTLRPKKGILVGIQLCFLAKQNFERTRTMTCIRDRFSNCYQTHKLGFTHTL